MEPLQFLVTSDDFVKLSLELIQSISEYNGSNKMDEHVENKLRQLRTIISALSATVGPNYQYPAVPAPTGLMPGVAFNSGTAGC